MRDDSAASDLGPRTTDDGLATLAAEIRAEQERANAEFADACRAVAPAWIPPPGTTLSVGNLERIVDDLAGLDEQIETRGPDLRPAILWTITQLAAAMLSAPGFKALQKGMEQHLGVSVSREGVARLVHRLGLDRDETWAEVRALTLDEAAAALGPPLVPPAPPKPKRRKNRNNMNENRRRLSEYLNESINEGEYDRTYADAARHLQIPGGTIKGRAYRDAWIQYRKHADAENLIRYGGSVPGFPDFKHLEDKFLHANNTRTSPEEFAAYLNPATNQVEKAKILNEWLAKGPGI